MNEITREKSKLGFVGVGYMGRPIAQRLLESGFRLSAYDRHRTKAEELIRYGGTVAESVAELSSSCDVVLSFLASDEAVLNIYKGADAAFANAHRGSLAATGLAGGGEQAGFLERTRAGPDRLKRWSPMGRDQRRSAHLGLSPPAPGRQFQVQRGAGLRL